MPRFEPSRASIVWIATPACAAMSLIDVPA